MESIVVRYSILIKVSQRGSIYNGAYPASAHVSPLHSNAISFTIYILDSAITSTMYASVASSSVVKACFVHFRGFLSLNSSAKIRELTTP